MKKVIPVALVTLLLVGVFYVYKTGLQKTNQLKSQPSVSPTSTAVSDSDKTVISEKVDSFYKSYDSCMKNPPAQAAGEVSVYCQDNSGFTTDTFSINLHNGGTAKAGADPIFCAQDIPESVNVNKDIQTTGDKAMVSVDEKFGPTQIRISVNLRKDGGTWKIDNIICPTP